MNSQTERLSLAGPAGRLEALRDLGLEGGIASVLGTRERINTPATTGPQNWTYRLPGTVEELGKDPHLAQLMLLFKRSIEKHGRA